MKKTLSPSLKKQYAKWTEQYEKKREFRLKDDQK